VTESRAYGVDYICDGRWHHTVVMAPGERSAAAHVRTSRPTATVMRAARLLPSSGFTLTPKEPK
jgi:hypothetical protein